MHGPALRGLRWRLLIFGSLHRSYGVCFFVWFASVVLLSWGNDMNGILLVASNMDHGLHLFQPASCVIRGGTTEYL